MKNYNLSEIAKEYATKNQCGLPLTSEQLLNSVVVYVNEEVNDLVSNFFPFTNDEKESVFNATKLSYSDSTVTTEYTSVVNGKKFTMKQPFGARENGGLTCGANESGTAMEVGIDMTGADENYVLTSVGGVPTWKDGQHLYNHIITLSTERSYVFLNILSVSPKSFTFGELSSAVFAVNYPCSGILFESTGNEFCLNIRGVTNVAIVADFGYGKTYTFGLTDSNVTDVVKKIF